jgi:hypothetical protein
MLKRGNPPDTWKAIGALRYLETFKSSLSHQAAKVFIGAAAGRIAFCVAYPTLSNRATQPTPNQRDHLSLHGARQGRALMRQKEARTLIIQEWDRWVKTQSIDPGGPSGRDTLKFFFELQDAQSPLLDFQSRGRDKWQIIHTWLLSEERVSAIRDWRPAEDQYPRGGQGGRLN